MVELFNSFFDNFIINKYKSIDTGHINESYMVEVSIDNEPKHFFAQKLNTSVFKFPNKIMENINKISQHLSSKKNYTYKVLKPIKSKNQDYGVYLNNNYWRIFNYIENSTTLSKINCPKLSYKISKCFSNFIFNISDLNADEINETIPLFHNINNTWTIFDKITREDRLNKVKNTKRLISKIYDRQDIIKDYTYIVKKMPKRITHNDTKFNNVLLDKDTLDPLAVIDLDTTMPGTILSDFGDMVRTFTNSCEEDHKNIDDIKFNLDIFKGIVKGFLEELNPIIKRVEKDNLVLGAKAMILEQVLRFTTDYLQDNKYYKIQYDEHNLYRALNQFKLLEELNKNEDKINIIINNIKI